MVTIFVSFAVGQLYLPNNSAWLGIIFGLFIALCFNTFTIRFLIGRLSLKDTIEAISCVKPILSRLLILSGSVLLVGYFFKNSSKRNCDCYSYFSPFSDV